MTLKHLLAGAVFAAGLAGSAAYAGTTIIGTEDNVNGFVGNFLESAFPGTQYIVASDGESAFDPFGAGYDTSDGLNFDAVGFTWTQAADSTWTPLTAVGSQVWVLPAVTSCGAENEPDCEPVGHFVSPSAWSPGAIGTWEILEAGGNELSDIIVTYNDANGANLKFYSDPSVPEPSAWLLMLVGFGGLGAMLRSNRRSPVLIA